MDSPSVELKSRVRQYVTTNFYVPTQGGLQDSTSLLEAGVIDSTGVLEIIGFLESAFGLKVDDDEIVPENLDSVDRISNYIARKVALAP